MNKTSDIKEKIIEVTTELITKSEGNIDEITIRQISEKAQVGVGLINYHFQTKENLIEICVQKMIEEVIAEFKPDVDQTADYLQKIKASSKAVMDFLINNPAVSRISILGDYVKPQLLDNTIKTVMGFSISLKDYDVAPDIKKIRIFAFVSTLQAVFLRKDQSKELFGFDFYIKEERDKYLDIVADSLFKEC